MGTLQTDSVPFFLPFRYESPGFLRTLIKDQLGVHSRRSPACDHGHKGRPLGDG